jgi:hypothetical protein
VRTARWILLLIVTIALFYWRILFTKQFSILWMWEPVVQSFSWYNFAATAIQKGILPIWDPYRFSGSTFIGEMQTGLFYPLKLLVYLAPLDGNGLVSERVYNEFYVLTHLLAAIFMFFLARHLRLSHFASFVAGLAFSLGGYLANTGHPHTLDSGIWLPLIVLFFLRSLNQHLTGRALFFAALSGLALGMAILAGGLHMVIMAGIVVGTMALVAGRGDRRMGRALAIAACVAVVGFLFGAIQVLPSLEYGPLSFRWVGGDGPIRSFQKVPYQYLGDLARFSPRSLLAFLFGGAYPGDHAPSNYFGVLPFFLSILGAWQFWSERWVKYLTVLGTLTFLYSWGAFSLLHGLLYLVPMLDMAREAGRFIQVTHFAMAILAAYGIEHLFVATAPNAAGVWGFVRVVRWLVILLAAFLIAGAVQSTIVIPDWVFLSFLFIAGTYVLLELALRQHRSALTQLALVFLLLWDAYSFNWIVRNKATAQAENHDHMSELLKSRKLAEFLQSRGGLFRVHFDTESPPNIGDAYGIQMTGGMSATMLMDYYRHLGHPKMAQLLNVRYTIRRADQPASDKPVFSDGVWCVYENPHVGDRAWVVHRIEIDPSTERPLNRLNDRDFDPGRVAIVDRAPVETIDHEVDAGPDSVETLNHDPTSMEFRVRTNSRGMLVVSEVFYPGWQALVNGQSVPIYRINGFMRGVEVPAGTSTVDFKYQPMSVRLGAAMGLAALAGTLLLGLVVFRRGTSRP